MMSHALICESIVEQVSSLERNVAREFSQRVQEFQISVAMNGLILEGRTRTYFTKSILQQAVIDAIHLPIAANMIVVDGSNCSMGQSVS